MVKQLIADPHQPCVLLHTRLEADADLLGNLRVFALLAPHLEVSGWGNNGNVLEIPGGCLLSAHKGAVWLVMGATVPFAQCSCGYVGASDGWQDITRHLKMTWTYDSAENGNIALTGELDLRQQQEFVLGIAFGHTLHQALVTLEQSLGIPFAEQRQRFVEQWHRKHQSPIGDMGKVASDSGKLAHVSHSLILAHEDKTFDGAMIASLSTPWGEVVGGDDIGGYHLVWTTTAASIKTSG
jgi:glucoamylase